MSVIGDRMRQLRGSSSQKEMAEAIGIKYNAWARYEAGSVLPGAEIIEKICRAHAVSADWLLGLDIQGSSTTISNSPNAIAISGNHISVKSCELPACNKCPYKKRLKSLEKLIQSPM